MKNKPKIDILGGGPAGLSVAYFARKKGYDICIHEGSSAIGGNCRTIKMGEYRFDTGAHRFHDKIPSITEEVKKLMGNDLKKINVPSKIYFDGRMIDFPLGFHSILKNLKLSEILKIVVENFFNIFGVYESVFLYPFICGFFKFFVFTKHILCCSIILGW